MKYQVKKIVEAIENKKGEDIKVYAMEGKTPYYDYSIICTGSSTRNVEAITTEVKDSMEIVKSIEGQSESEWVLIDGGDIIVNIFTKDARSYYKLDELYGEI
nr:ribosome silencing factor [Caviibacter abscessus]